MMKYLVWAIVIIILLGGGYYAYTTYGPGAASPNAQANGDVVQAQDVQVGTGAQAAPGSVVSVLYVGRLSDGTVFDSSEAHDNQPLTFQLGSQGIIPGFQVGVNGMREGGQRVIAVPPSFGYGAEDVKDADGNVVIPGNSTLVFEIQLLKVEAAPATTSTDTTAQ